MSDDGDGACCTNLVVFTPAWSRCYGPRDGLADRMFVVACERRDGADVEPVLVATPALLVELLSVLAPPSIAIRSAAGEDVCELRRLVELACVTGTPH